MPTNPYTSQAISNYNNSPPPDDGTTGSDNQLEWAKHKAKLADPIKSLAENINSQALGAFAKTINTDDDEANAVGGSIAYSSSEITLATSGSVTPTRTHHTVAPTPATATADDLDTLATGSVGDGALVLLRAADADKRITVRSGQGNIFGANRILSPNIAVPYFHVGANWHELALPPGYISGLTLSNGSDSDHDIDIATGSARCDIDSENINVGATLTIAIDASAGINSIDTGSVANSTLYAVWVLKRTDTGAVGGVFSTNFSSPTMPSNYDRKRLIGAVKTDGSGNIIGFIQNGDRFTYTGDIITDVNDSTITTDTAKVGTLSVPPNCIADVYFNITNSSGQARLRGTLRRNGAADAAGESVIDVEQTSVTNTVGAGLRTSVAVDGSSQVQYLALESSGTVTIQIRSIGFDMLTRSNP